MSLSRESTPLYQPDLGREEDLVTEDPNRPGYPLRPYPWFDDPQPQQTSNTGAESSDHGSEHGHSSLSSAEHDGHHDPQDTDGQVEPDPTESEGIEAGDDEPDGEDDDPEDPEPPREETGDDEDLPPYESCLRTIQEVYDGITNGLYDLAPNYQRGLVWDKKNKVNFIGSILRGHPTGNFIFNMIGIGSEGLSIRCLDGQQRLSTITNFINGVLPADYQNKMVWYLQDEGRRVPDREYLSAEKSEAFLAKRLSVDEYVGLKYKAEVQVFRCLQRGVRLSVGENWKAPIGDWEKLAGNFIVEYPQVIGCE